MPRIEHLVEASIYTDDLERAELFYRDVLQLELQAKDPDRHVFFRAGNSMLLVFRSEATRVGDTLPAHGCTGPGHFALGIPTDSVADWRAHLQQHGVEIEHEMNWDRGGHSLYFRDPAGNSVELVTRGLWGLPAGW